MRETERQRVTETERQRERESQEERDKERRVLYVTKSSSIN